MQNCVHKLGKHTKFVFHIKCIKYHTYVSDNNIVCLAVNNVPFFNFFTRLPLFNSLIDLSAHLFIFVNPIAYKHRIL